MILFVEYHSYQGVTRDNADMPFCVDLVEASASIVNDGFVCLVNGDVIPLHHIHRWRDQNSSAA